MTQYLPKAALVAEIENLKNTYKKCPTRNSYEEGLKEGRLIGYRDALYKINTLEVKEVDFEDTKSVFEGQYLSKDKVVTTIERLQDECEEKGDNDGVELLEKLFNKLNTLDMKEVDLEKYYHEYLEKEWFGNSHVRTVSEMMAFTAKHFFELGLKAQHDNWKVVDNINLPQADRNKIYCVLSKNKYLLARVINHPHDDELLQWRCTEFPFHRYDMCEGDKYMQIV